MLPLHIVRAAAAHTAPVPQNPFLLRQQRGKSDVAPAKTTRAGNNPASGWTTALLRFWCIIMHVHRGNVRSTVCFMPAVRFSDAVARPTSNPTTGCSDSCVNRARRKMLEFEVVSSYPARAFQLVFSRLVFSPLAGHLLPACSAVLYT
jgi:hypothetical protein